MTPEEAIAVFDKMLKRYAWAEDNKSVQAIKVAKECIEKQIAKKPIDERYPWSICPVCGGSINCEEVQEYIHNKECSHCVHCGQKIDWSDTE